MLTKKEFSTKQSSCFFASPFITADFNRFKAEASITTCAHHTEHTIPLATTEC